MSAIQGVIEMWDSYNRLGWKVFNHDPKIVDWAQEAKSRTISKLCSRQLAKHDLRCGGTWFPGVRFLDNNDLGALGSTKLEGNSVGQISKKFGKFFKFWDPAQISVIYPGYPKRVESESENAFKFRKEKFGSHVDGVIPIGKSRKRFIKEFHTFIYGISISEFDELAAPLIAWEGSHHIFRSALEQVLKHLEPTSWPDLDITMCYNEVRKHIFKKCKPRVIWVPIGGSFIIHRLCLHGVAPWGDGAFSEPSGRMIAYFRPNLIDSGHWSDDSV